MCIINFRLSTAVVLTQIFFEILPTQALSSGNGLEIWPNLTSYTLTPDMPEEKRTLTCKGTESIRWYFRQYDGTLLTKKSFSIKVFSTGDNRYTYLATLSLNKATYLDTGYYTCAPSEKLFYHKDIYIYVYHKTHLLAVPGDFKLGYDMENGVVFVPSRATSTDVHVEMTSNYEHIRNSYESYAETCHPIKQFRCRNIFNGTCIPDYAVCNGYPDCLDGYDEDETMCKARNCASSQEFRCTDGVRCLHDALVCDGTSDCNDGSDEEETMCQAKTCHPILPFKCANGLQCLRGNKVCNGEYDCKDGSDENDTTCQVAKMCNFKWQFKCTDFNYRNKLRFDTRFNHTHYSCISNLLYVCNGQRYCSDGSDENPIMCQEKTCDQETEFRCKTGACIDIASVCDGYKLCIDGSDEDEDMCENERIGHGSYDNGSILLHIKNVSTDDVGNYICTAMAVNGLNYSKTYRLNAYHRNINYTNLKIDDGIQKIIRPAGYENVRWTIRISCIGNTSLQWRAPNGRALKTQTANTCMNYNNSCVSEVIMTNLKLSDSGDYTLAAYNGAELNKINVTIIVEEKPTVLFVKGLESHRSHYEFGKNYSFVFFIRGYPLPSVECAVKKCPTYPMCEQSHSETKRIESKIIQVSEIAIKLVISMNVTDTATLICNASNILGNHSKQHTILVTDVSNGLEIRGPSTIFTGDNITIQCYASIVYNYINEIKWNYPEDSLNQKNINIVDDRTTFSYRSRLMITNISKNLNGHVNCTVKRISQINDRLPAETETKSFEVYVEDPRVPVINNSSDTYRTVESDYGDQVVLKCSAVGLPYPTISWFKENRSWPFEENHSRVLMQFGNQTLLIDFTEMENERTYTCNASNQIGSSVLSYVLKLKKTNNKNQTVGVVLFCMVIAIFLGIIVIGCVIGLNRRRTLINTMAVLEMYKLEEGAVIHENMGTLFRWSFPLDKLELGKRLGSGAFGVVYKAKAEGIIHKNIISNVAVKTVNANADSCCLKALESELKMMINIGKHSNIVNLLGLCTGHVDRKLMIIVEYCRYGCINQYIRKRREYFINQFTSEGFIDLNGESSSNNPIYKNGHEDTVRTKTCEDNDNLVDAVDFFSSSNNDLSPERHSNTDGNYNNRNEKLLCTLDLIQWSYQIAKGMDFLASKKILHGDLAARNILLADGNIVKICDFGLSRTLRDSGVYKKKPKKDLLPFKWMAIESIGDLVFSTQSDVWSFGIVMWEMFSLAATPYPNLQLCDLYDKLRQGYRMEQPIYANSIIYNMMMDCWEADPIKRTSFADLTDRLSDLIRDCTKSDYVSFNDNSPEEINETFVETNSVEHNKIILSR